MSATASAISPQSAPFCIVFFIDPAAGKHSSDFSITAVYKDDGDAVLRDSTILRNPDMGNVHNSAVDYAKQVRDALPASHNTRVAFHVTSRMGNEVAWIQKWIQYSNSEFYKECTFLKSSEKPLSVSEMIDIAEEFGAVEQ